MVDALIPRAAVTAIAALAGAAAATTASNARECTVDAPLPASVTDELVPSFFDDFGGFSLHDNGEGTWQTAFAWSPPHGGNLAGNRELQWYVNAPHPPTREIAAHRIEDGVLVLEAARTPPEFAHEVEGHPYTSGMISSHSSFSQLHGYFEIRAKLPSGRGLWPAFWLLPVDTSWPPEIDVLEVKGHDTRTVHMGVHYDDGGTPRKRGFVVEVADTSRSFHTFAVLWRADVIRWFVDGVEVASAPTPPGLDQPMYLLANLAVGGWAGAPDAQTRFPARMRIDCVRAHRIVSTAGNRAGHPR